MSLHPRWLVGSACLVVFALSAGGCDPSDDSDSDPLRTDLVQRVGSADTLDIATWQIRHLGTTGPEGQDEPTDLALVADIIASLDLDVIAVQDVTSETAWAELDRRLPEHDAVLSSYQHSDGRYQKIGFLYRRTARVVSVDDMFNDHYFSRLPVRALFRYDDGVHAEVTFAALGVHLEDGTTASDMYMRQQSGGVLDTYAAGQLATSDAEHDIVILGDYNSQFGDGEGNSLTPLHTHDGRYAFRTAAASAAGESSHVSNRFIDHIVTSAGFGGAAEAHAIRVDQDPDVIGYETYVSDHYPVVVSIPLAPR